MLFNSLHFVVFLPIAVALHFLAPQRWRWVVLLACSYYFYMSWRPIYGLLLGGTTVVDYIAGIAIAASKTRARRRLMLSMSLTANLGVLFTFKYLGFFAASANALVNALGGAWSWGSLDILLPVGVSFYTFQSLSYTIDVYRGVIQPERHFGIFAVYVSFFPQLVAGPIERPHHLLPQFRKRHRFDVDRIESGLKLMLWGFFKKLVIADRLAGYVKEVYGNSADYGGMPHLIATYFFAFQIYCDFSAYSEIAKGTARLLGYDLMDNFKRPYLAVNIQDFWRRWHISLTSWFRDYLYIPLGGNRVSPGRLRRNVLIVFVVSGLWHGANWTFVVWGALHGVYSLAYLWWRSRRAPGWQPEPRPIQTLLSMLLTFHLVVLAWVFFRAESVGHAMTVLGTIFSPHWAVDVGVKGISALEVGISVGFIGLLMALEWLGGQDFTQTLARRHRGLRWSLYYAVVLLIFNFGMFHSPSEFIYFQF
jgi:D-alanyl-lipoteichoic acid acyltransferase DltB (MBOAT superfamily)